MSNLTARFVDGGLNAQIEGVNVTINNNGGGAMPWVTVAQSQTLVIDTAHVITASTLASLYLPVNTYGGAQVIIYTQNIPGWVLNQRDGERVRLGDRLTTLGVSGYVQSSAMGDFIRLGYVNGMWSEIGMSGNLEVI